MQTIRRFLVMSLMILAVLSLVACGGSNENAGHVEPYELEEVAGSEFQNVILTAKAAERLDIQSEALNMEDVDGEMKLVAPYSAVLYDLNGETYAYTRNAGPSSLTFIRAPIEIERIEGGRVILTNGPPEGTHLVTVGAAELYGADTGVGK